MVVTKIATKKKKQEKANNSPSYRCAAINNYPLFSPISKFEHGHSFLKLSTLLENPIFLLAHLSKKT